MRVSFPPLTLALLLVPLASGCSGDDADSPAEASTATDGSGNDSNSPTTTSDDASSGEGDASSGGDERSGPPYDGQFHIETAKFPAGGIQLTFVTSNPAGELLCLYQSVAPDFNDELVMSVEVPPRQLLTMDHPSGGSDSVRVRRGSNGECPPPNGGGRIVFEGALIAALQGDIHTIPIPTSEWAVDLEGRGHGAIVNASSTEGAFCIIEPDAEEGSYAYFFFDAQDTYSLNDGFLDLTPGTETFIVPGDSENCLMHTKWLEDETNAFYFGQENGMVSYFVAFDGA